MIRSCNFLSFGVMALAISAAPALAQSRTCDAHASVVATLAEKFGETRQSIGLSQDNAMIEVFASKKTGTWTITVTKPNGSTCLVAAGEAFESVDETLPTPGDPA